MLTQTPIIHVVDDDDSFRTAVMRLLKAAGYDVRGYPSAAEFQLTQPADVPGCVLLDVRMPGSSGLDLQASLGKQKNALPIIFLTGHGDIPMSVRAIKAGAVDFLTKPIKREALLSAIESALTADREARAAREQEATIGLLYESLTPQERAVFSRVVEGKLNKQIALELDTSERTVKSHRAKVMEKLRVTSLAELIRVAEHIKATITHA